MSTKTTCEIMQAYAVLAEYFGTEVYDLIDLLTNHFQKSATPTTEPEQGTYLWNLDEIRQTFIHIDELRARGMIPPLKRYVVMSSARKGKRGKVYIASDEQLQDELAMQRRSSIDSNGNLIVDGQIAERGWLQSFDKINSAV